MEYVPSILLVMVLFLIGVISPGPNFLVVVQQSLHKGQKAGVVTSLGIALGDFIYASAGLFGLTMLIGSVGWLFGLIKIIGGIYLIYLGINMFRNSDAATEKCEPKINYSLFKCFRLGLLTDLANPKTIIFFASIFAAVVQPESPIWVLCSMLTGIVLSDCAKRRSYPAYSMFDFGKK